MNPRCSLARMFLNKEAYQRSLIFNDILKYFWYYILFANKSITMHLFGRRCIVTARYTTRRIWAITMTKSDSSARPEYFRTSASHHRRSRALLCTERLERRAHFHNKLLALRMLDFEHSQWILERTPRLLG